MNPLFFQIPNWTDQIAVVTMATLFMACEILVIEMCVWGLIELSILIYERLRGRIMRLEV